MIARLRKIFVCCANGRDNAVLTPEEAAAEAAVVAYENELIRRKCVASLLRSCSVESSVIPPPKWRKRYGRRVPIGPNGALALCEHLLRQREEEQANPTTNHTNNRITLDLNGLRIGDDGIRALVPFISSDDRLVSLVLSGNNITDEGLGVLLDALAGSPKTLQRLSLGDNAISAAGAMRVVEACGSGLLPALCALSLSSPAHPPAKPEKEEMALAVGLSRLLRGDGCPPLAALDVRHPMGDAAAAVLAGGVADAPRLAALRLRSCGLSAEGLRRIADALVANRTLVALDVSRQTEANQQPQTTSPERPLLPIIKALHSNHTLRTLTAYGIDVVDDDVEELCACVERSGNTAIQCVHLTGVTSRPLAIKLENLLMRNARRISHEGTACSRKSSHPNSYTISSEVNGKDNANAGANSLQTVGPSFPKRSKIGSSTQRRTPKFKERIALEGMSSHSNVKLPPIGNSTLTSVISLQNDDGDENEINETPERCGLNDSMSDITMSSMSSRSCSFSPKENFGQPLYTSRPSLSKQKHKMTRTLRGA
ncbi:uncharacterized protein TM35_000014260 [Trypanosoma theileri]|uniref:Leucine-rich repeat protein (LRRP) n=1 Tax=Trypanosoma theileri TaxID=67003 RepID=A0A1X0PAC8_9TRYP|nr:uncharacterized protein TM35_000014260 [Trypanosoma theileri]ORC93549.1 hypothetical protein TM35_000014260 [Trypanosoma theileri]